MTTSDELLALLDNLGIPHTTRDHPPVLTVEEMMAVCGDMPGAHTKNLFLRDAKKRFFLVTLRHDAALDLKALRPVIGARGNLSFASAEALMEKLGVVTGSVSPLAVVNDAAGEVTVCVEDAVMAADLVNVHPLTSARTTALAPDGLRRFLAHAGREPLVFTRPAPEA